VIEMEQRLREELRRITDQVQSGELRPLRAPERGRVRRRRLLLAGAITAGTAIAATAAVVATLLVSTAASPRPVTVPATAPAGLPPFYVVATQSASAGPVQVVVRDTVNGQETGSLTVPNAEGRWAALAGTGDGRHFVVEAASTSGSRFYALSVSADGRPALRLAATYSSTTNPLPNGPMALSPDGTEVALSWTILGPCPAGSPSLGCNDFQIEVLNLVTKATRTWNEYLPSVAFPRYTPGVVSWASNTSLMFTWDRTNSQTADGPASVAIRTINTAAPGNDVTTSAPISIPATVANPTRMTVADQGREIIGTSCAPAGSSTAVLRGTGVARVVELSAADGWAVHQYRTQTTYFRWPARVQVATDTSCMVESVDPSGQYALVLAFGLGRFYDGIYTPMPGFQLYLTNGDPMAQAAW
jgi:hypothetical protein